MIRDPKRIISVLALVVTVGCGGGGGGGEGQATGTDGSGVVLTPISPSIPAGPESGSPAPRNAGPVSADSRAKWDSSQATCLNSNQEVQYNTEPLGKDAQCVDFSNQNLTGFDFSNFNLSGANFKNAILTKVNFDGATLVGLVLDGAEVDSSTVLLWLKTGVRPTDLVVKDPHLERPIIIVDNNTLPTKGNSSSADEPVIDIARKNLAEIEDQLKASQRDSILKQLESQIGISALQVQRQIEQSFDQINDLQLAEAKLDLKSVDISKSPDIGKDLQNEIAAKEEEQAKIEDKVSLLVREIQQESKDLSDQEEISERIKQGLSLIVNGRAPAAPVVKEEGPQNENQPIEDEIQIVDKEISREVEQSESEWRNIADQENRIEVLSRQAGELTEKIQALLKESAHVEEQQKASTQKSDSSKLAKQLETLTDRMNEWIVQEKQLRHQIAALREQVAEPKKKSDDRYAKIHVLKERRGALAKKLSDLEFFGHLAKAKNH
jgi:hypothetical protein